MRLLLCLILFAALASGQAFFHASAGGAGGSTGSGSGGGVPGGGGGAPDPLLLAGVTFAPNPGFYTGSVSVTLSGPTGATICYTTDSSAPTATTAGACSHGSTFTGSLTLYSTTAVLAIATQTGKHNSYIKSGVYIFAGYMH